MQEKQKTIAAPIKALITIVALLLCVVIYLAVSRPAPMSTVLVETLSVGKENRLKICTLLDYMDMNTEIITEKEVCSTDYEGLAQAEAKKMIEKDGLDYKTAMIDGKAQGMTEEGGAFVFLFIVDDIVIRADFVFTSIDNVGRFYAKDYRDRN